MALAVVLGGTVYAFTRARQRARITGIDSFAACAQAGYPVLATYPAQCRTPDGRVFISQDEAVRSVVERFGSAMKQVSLSAPRQAVANAMEQNYASVLAPDLLARWKENPAEAFGRVTSSPWPERIVIFSAVQQENGRAQVLGAVIEKTSADSAGTFAFSYPIALTLEKSDGDWRISAASRTWPQTANGILGTTLLGPTCPVVRNPPLGQCADKPYQGNFEIMRAGANAVVARFTSQEDGLFAITLPPGQYDIRNISSQRMLPRCASNGTVDVVAGSYATTTVLCDTGIR